MARERNYSLDAIRVIMAFCVVLGHAALANGAIHICLDDFGWWWTNIIYAFTRWSVPMFVMVSGAFLLYPYSNTGLLEFYKKRVNRIAIPFLFWTVIYAIRYGFNSSGDYVLSDTLALFAKAYVEPTDGVLWYLYMIILLYFFAPFFRKIIANSTPNELYILILGTSCMAIVLPHITPYFPIAFIGYLCFFIAGQCFYLYPIKFSKKLLLAIFLIACILTVLGSAFISPLYFRLHRCIFCIVSSMAIFMLILQIQIPQKLYSTINFLVELTFGIYLVHGLWMYVAFNVTNCLLKSIAMKSIATFLKVPLAGCIAFMLSALTSYIILREPYLKRVI